LKEVVMLAIAVFALVSSGQMAVFGNFFRELGEALVGCLILARQKEYQLAVWLAAGVGVVVATGLAAWLRHGNSVLEHRWHNFAGVLSVAMPFMLLAFAAWHLLPHTLHHHMLPGRSARKAARKQRSSRMTMIGLAVSAFLLVIREGVEFALLSLNEGTARVVLGAVIGGGAMFIVWWFLRERLENSIVLMNLALIVTGLWMILHAEEAFITDAHWSRSLLGGLQLAYVLVAVVVAALVWLRRLRPSRPIRL
jgi:hypothetical protein